MSDFLQPNSLAEALHMRAEHPDYVVLAGGTDYMVGMRERPPAPGLIDVFGLAELCAVEHKGNATSIGAAVPYAALLADNTLAKRFPSLRACVRQIGAVQIQSRGTVGGNIATSSPVGDTLPVWLALAAEVEVVSIGGARRIPYDDFCTGYRQTALRSDELIKAVHVPVTTARVYWRKVGTRHAQAISKVMIAAAAVVDGGLVKSMRIALGAVADRPLRFPQIEALAVGREPSAALAEQLKDALSAAITPIDDVRSSADYRREVAGNMLARFIKELVL